MVGTTGVPKREPVINDGRRLMTPADLAAMLSKSEKTLAQWRWRGIGPPHLRLEGGAVRYRWPDVEKWLAAQAR